MDKQQLMAALRETGVVAVIRTEDPGSLVEVSRALRDGGVRFVEITMTVPGALAAISEASLALRDQGVFIGAGTVLDAETARAAIIAGASFVVGPAYDQAMVDVCHTYSVAAMPGGLTPTEIVTAWRGGADVVKVFPAQNLGGADYLKAIKEPLPQIELMPTRGVDFTTAGAFIRAGAIAVGIGGALVDKSLIARKEYRTIADNARRMIEIVHEARGS